MPPRPTILAFDTSAASCAAALLSGGRVVAERLEEMTKGQAERLVPLLQELMDEANLTFKQLDAIGVGIGPGNFTGIRISVATARGLAMSLAVPAVGVSSLEALAEGVRRPTLSVVDARREMAYVQLFETDKLHDPQMISLAAVPEDLAHLDLTCVGRSADRLAATLDAQSQWSNPNPAPIIARITARRFQTATDRPAPLYLRPADATPLGSVAPPILP